MKKIFKKSATVFFRLAGKSLLVTAKAAPSVLSGIAHFARDLSSDSYYVFAGNKKKQKLIKKLYLQNSQHRLKKLRFKSDYPFADACVLSGLTASEMYLGGVPNEIQEAFNKAYPNLSSDQSFLDTWSGFEDYEARLGFVSAIKGKLFEIMYVEHLNESLEPGYSAAMALDPTEKGWDIKITGPDQEITELLQLKATTSTSYIKDAIDKYPEIDIVTLSDLQGQLSSISSLKNVSASDISDEELMIQINEATDGSTFFFPTVPLLALGYLVFSGYREKDLSQFKRHQKFGKRASNLVLNTSIISVTASPFIGIPLVIGKEYLFQGARKNKEIIKFLKSQIKRNKKTQKVWEKQTSRRSFLKGLGLASATLIRNPKSA